MTSFLKVTVTSSITFSPTAKEGQTLTTTINLHAGTEASGNLVENATVYWKVEGITADDLESTSPDGLSGSGTIVNGQLILNHKLKADTAIENENLAVSLFSDASMNVDVQIGMSASTVIQDTILVRGNSIYAIVDGPSWSQAEANSVKLGGHLVSLASQGEQDFVWNRLSTYGFIGLTDEVEEGVWQWSDGSSFAYSNWAKESPDNAIGPNGLSQDYAVMGWPLASVPGQWDDQWYQQVIEGLPGISETHFIRRGDSAYVIAQGFTREEAEANAQELGGSLVVSETIQETEWLRQTFYSQGAIDSRTVFWQGAVAPTFTAPTFWYDKWHGIGGTYWVDMIAGIREPDYNYRYGIAEIQLRQNSAPTGIAAVFGAFKAGQTISIDMSLVRDTDNFTGWTPTYTYGWEVSSDNGTTWLRLASADAIDNFTTYTLSLAEVGKNIRGVVSYVDGYGSNEVVASDSSALIADAAPVFGTQSLNLGYLEPGFSFSLTASLTSQLSADFLDGGLITYGPPSSTGIYGSLTVSTTGVASFTGVSAAITAQATSTLTDSFSVTATNGTDSATATYNVAIANPSAENTLLITATASGSIDGISFGSTATSGAYAGMLLNAINLGAAVDTATLTDAAGTSAALTLNGGNGFDRLNGNASANNLTLTGLDSGTLDQVSFSSIENIYLQGGNDTVTIAAGGRLSGILDGGTGSNTLIIDDTLVIGVGTDGSFIITDGGGGSGGSFTGFGTIQGGGGGSGGKTNSLTLNTISNVVAITGPNSGTADGTAFTNISDINLAAGDDYAILAAVGSLSGTLKGGPGVDDLTLNASANTLSLDHTGAGTAISSGNAVSTAFNGFEVIRLDAGSDTADLSFSATTAFVVKQQLRLEGGLDNDTLTLTLSLGEWQNLQTTNQFTALLAYLAEPTGQSITINFLQTTLTLSGFETGVLTTTDLGQGTPGSITSSSQGIFQEGVTLIAPGVSGDPNGDASTSAYTYQWYKDNVLISGATISSYLVPNIGAGTYKVAITYTDNQGFRASVDSPTQVVTAVNNGNGTAGPITSSTPGVFQEGVTLTAPTVTGDTDGDAVNPNYAYQWYKNGTQISGATSSTYAVGNTAAGTYKVQVTSTDAQGFTASVDSADQVVTAVNNGNGTAGPIISSTPGVFQEGVTLTAPGVTGDTDGDAVNPNYAYQWFKDGSAINNATSLTYLISSSGVGIYKVRVVSTDAQGFISTLESQNCIVSKVNNGNGTVGSIASSTPGVFQEGSTLIAPGVVSDPDGDALNPSYSYQWYRNNTAIPGATAGTYAVSATGAGTYRVQISYGDAQGYLATLNSPDQIVSSINNGNGVAGAITSSIAGVFQEGVTLTAPGVTGDPDGIALAPNYAYQWYRNNAAIAGAIGGSYVVSTGSAGTYRVQVTYGHLEKSTKHLIPA